MKTFTEILCPVCGEFYFEDNTIDYCLHCGWKYDLLQYKNPNLSHKTNELSLVDYKIWFNNRINENPTYDYTDETYVKDSHKCPVCNQYTFSDIDSHEICPICGWEDDELMENEPDNWAGCSNELSLNDYRYHYQQKSKK